MSLAWFLPLPGSYAGVDVVGVYNFACSLREVLAKHPFLPHGCGLFSGSYFPSFSEGLSLRAARAAGSHRALHFPSFSEGLSLRVRFAEHALTSQRRFPFLFGGTFIEALCTCRSRSPNHPHFPSFLEGLSLRPATSRRSERANSRFPFLLGGTFIEARAALAVEKPPQ